VGGRDVTFLEAVTSLGARAAQIICVGTCAAWGGISAAAPNPTGVQSVGAVTLRTTVNIPGCPPHPDWMIGTIAGLLGGTLGTLDSYGRPVSFFKRPVHDQCPRKGTEPARTYGEDGRCLKEIGCLGPQTVAPCPQTLWNNRTNWCVDANAVCISCTNPASPKNPLRKEIHV
jgi:hydrogenase small subunit